MTENFQNSIELGNVCDKGDGYVDVSDKEINENI